MILSKPTENGTAILVEGRLDTATAPDFRQALNAVPEDSAVLTVDLGNTLYISSAGLRELLIARKRFTGDRMKVVAVSDAVMEILRITGFDTLLPIESGNRAEFVHLSIRDFLSQKVTSCGDDAAIRDCERDWTWRDLDLGSTALAKRLYEKGVRKGTHVGLAGTNSVNYILCFYAIEKLGALAVLMNYNLKPAELNRHVERGDVSLLCIGNLSSGTDRELLEKELLNGKNGLNGLFFFEDTPAAESVLAGQSIAPTFLPPSVEPDDACLMIFTSGSTGEPKGVLLSAYNVLNASEISRRSQHLTENSVCCNILPLFHIFGLVAGLFASAFGDSLLVLPKDMHMSTLIDTIESNRCTVFHAVPTLFLAMMTNKDFCPERLSSLRCTILSGSAATKAQLELFREKLPENHFLSSYGLSEMAPVTITEYEDSFSHITDTVGKPMEHVEMKIAALSDGHECAPGETGEILLQGYNLMAGYYKTGLDSQSIDADGWLHTGDLGYLREDGYLHLNGRIKELIIRGGENIMPLDVAQAVNRLDGVSDVKVVGVPSEFYGEEVAACIVLKEGAVFDEKEARAQLAEKLAAFKIPSYFFIFREFPLLSNGKIDSLAITAEAKRRAADAAGK